MESFLGDVTQQYPDLALFETTEGLRMPDENAHVWMSVSRYRGQVDFIAERLCEISPEHAQELQANARAYDSKLAELEAQQEEILEKAKGRKIISFHDAYAYVADDYGLVTEYSINLDEERQSRHCGAYAWENGTGVWSFDFFAYYNEKSAACI